MVNPGAPITKADLDALATLANTKLSPAQPYAFPAFAGKDQIALPSDITPTPAYGSGSFIAGDKITLWLFGYKTIAGTKTYSWSPLVKAFYPVLASGNYGMSWTWVVPTGTTAPDGFIAAIPRPASGGFEFRWKDIGNVATLTEDGTFSGWNLDSTLDQRNIGFPAQNMPCGHGAWLKVLNQIHQDLFTGMNLFGGSSITFDPAFLLSGPWCVSVAQKCYLYLNSTSIYRNLEFWYSEADSATGNEIAPEADMAEHIGVTNGNNSFDWSQNVIVNGRLVMLSSPAGQSSSDWALSGPAGVTTSFNPFFSDPVAGIVTGLIFDFDNVPYTLGVPITITATPLSGGSVIDAGDPFGTGGLADLVFTGDTTAYSASDTTAIHYAGKAAKKVSLANSLPQITLTTAIGGTFAVDSHYRSFCNGVFVANTLPTLGLMTYLDQDLPQYNPQPPPNALSAPSSRREPISPTNPVVIPHVDNRGALWPVFRDTDFVPDSLAGQPFNGSKAWQTSIVTKFVEQSTQTNVIAPSGLAENLTYIGPFSLPAGAADLRIYIADPNLTLYIKTGTFPTTLDYDAKQVCGSWFLLSASLPGFTTPADYYVGLLNPTVANISATAFIVIVDDGTAPNGTFFPTVKDDSGNNVAQTEGHSYHWGDTNADLRPIPLFGYSVDSITIRRHPVDNGSGIFIAPSTGTSALDVDIGLPVGFSWSSAGTFQKITTLTIPAGQSDVQSTVFFPVLSGTSLAYQCPEQVMMRTSVNFQPLMCSQFFPETVNRNGQPYQVGTYSGQPFYNQYCALLSFIGGTPQTPVLLPVAASVFNDLESLLNLLP